MEFLAIWRGLRTLHTGPCMEFLPVECIILHPPPPILRQGFCSLVFGFFWSLLPVSVLVILLSAFYEVYVHVHVCLNSTSIACLRFVIVHKGISFACHTIFLLLLTLPHLGKRLSPFLLLPCISACGRLTLVFSTGWLG